MAMFGSYFGLCPLIDHRSLLGISEVSENGKILVTLGKNMSMQYNLADQKQTLSWTTKEKFTSPVLFDFETNKYVAVFNQMYMRCWDSKDSSLDKVKKLKFKKNIFTVIMSKRNGFVIFQNGFTIKLNEALLNHKTLEPEGILNENEYIVDVLSCTLNANVYIGLVVGNSDSSETSRLLWAVFDSREDGDTYSQLSLKRDGCELAGIAFHLSNEQVEILTFWSDGKLFVKPLEDKTDNLGEIYSVIESISGNHPVSIVSLDKDYIAMYGDNSNQEGALLIIYNMQFKVTQCRQPFKLLTIGAKLWSIQENLILPVGQNLAVVPFYLEKEQLSALVGSHRMNPNNTKDVLIVHNLKEVTWSKLNDVTDSTINNDVKRLLKTI
ncbi:hypothetical protein HHI36_005890 [Cryptolaemus montrouzieri]|uniref:Nucleolar protein 11 N-terminal domain-containing protein n=1 Tax=Cryptolaemus montrouzieri TaxID=559131 RepID=A0ABD2NVG6_9CUCU